MSVSNVEFFFEPLTSCVSIVESVKTLQIIPALHILDTDDVFGLMAMNRLGVLLDIGGLKVDRDILISIVALIRKNTLGCLLLDSEISNDTTVYELTRCRCDYVMENTYVAYATYYDVETGRNLLKKEILPIFFTNFKYSSYASMFDMLRNFKETFSQFKRKVIEISDTSITNLVPMTGEEIFYTCRGKDFKMVLDDGETIIEVPFDNGFPATDAVTDLYSCNGSEIPVTSHHNEYATACPEVNFYREVGVRIRNSLMTYFHSNISEKIL